MKPTKFYLTFFTATLVSCLSLSQYVFSSSSQTPTANTNPKYNAYEIQQHKTQATASTNNYKENLKVNSDTVLQNKQDSVATYPNKLKQQANANQELVSVHTGYTAFVQVSYDTSYGTQDISKSAPLALTLFYTDSDYYAHTVSTGVCSKHDDPENDGSGVTRCYLYDINPATTDFKNLIIGIKPQRDVILVASSVTVTYFDENNAYLDTVTSKDNSGACYAENEQYYNEILASFNSTNGANCDNFAECFVTDVAIDYTYTAPSTSVTPSASILTNN